MLGANAISAVNFKKARTSFIMAKTSRYFPRTPATFVKSVEIHLYGIRLNLQYSAKSPNISRIPRTQTRAYLFYKNIYIYMQDPWKPCVWSRHIVTGDRWLLLTKGSNVESVPMSWRHHEWFVGGWKLKLILYFKYNSQSSNGMSLSLIHHLGK